MDNGSPVQQEIVLNRVERSMLPGLAPQWPKPNAWLALEIVGALCVGLLVGKTMFGFGSAAPTLDLSQGQWVRSAGGGFELFLPKGWENFTAEANVGLPDAAKRELVFRQKGSSGTRLFVLHRGKANNDALGNWIVGQRREMFQMRQQMGTVVASAPPGIPVAMLHMIRPAGGPQTISGEVVFKGSFYGFSYATPSSSDDELLLGLLGSMREVKGATPPSRTAKPAAARPSPKPAVKKTSAKAKK